MPFACIIIVDQLHKMILINITEWKYFTIENVRNIYSCSPLYFVQLLNAHVIVDSKDFEKAIHHWKISTDSNVPLIRLILYNRLFIQIHMKMKYFLTFCRSHMQTCPLQVITHTYHRRIRIFEHFIYNI